MMSFTRSMAIVELVCCTGRRPLSGIRSSDVPGWQSTKYSPISDCGLISQRASLRRAASPRPAAPEVPAAQPRRPDLAARVLAQVREPRLGHLRRDCGERAPVLLHDLERRGLPGSAPGDLEVAPLGEPEGVVEEQVVGLAAAVVVRLGAE